MSKALPQMRPQRFALLASMIAFHCKPLIQKKLTYRMVLEAVTTCALAGIKIFVLFVIFVLY